MSDTSFERRGIDPFERLKEEFRTAVRDCYGRDPVNPGIKPFVDRDGHGVDIEEFIPGASPGQRTLLNTTYYLNLGGELSKEVDSEEAKVRLARDIRSNSVNGSSTPTFAQEVKELRVDFGCSEEEAIQIITDATVFMASEDTIKALFRYLKAREEQEKLGLNAVDAFELRDVIKIVRNNFPGIAA